MAPNLVSFAAWKAVGLSWGWDCLTFLLPRKVVSVPPSCQRTELFKAVLRLIPEWHGWSLLPRVLSSRIFSLLWVSMFFYFTIGAKSTFSYSDSFPSVL